MIKIDFINYLIINFNLMILSYIIIIIFIPVIILLFFIVFFTMFSFIFIESYDKNKNNFD